MLDSMRKTLFFEGKLPSCYNFEVLLATGVTHIMAPAYAFTPPQIARLREHDVKLEPVVTMQSDTCPCHPLVWDDLQRHINKALPAAFNGSGIMWFDHVRFSGKWEQSMASPPGIHEDCSLCEGKNRLRSIANLARKITNWLPPNIEAGCFTVPIGKDYADTRHQLGQDVVSLGKRFNYVSPMMYHRSLGWSVGQTAGYLSWLKERVSAKVLPILQVKDFPDGVPDQLTEAEMAEVHTAVRNLDLPTAWFSWDGALEKGKTKALARIWQ